MSGGRDATDRLSASVDRAAILTVIFERNHVRRDARLPLLDVRAEFDQAVSEALNNSFNGFLKPITAEFDGRISLKWIARWQRKNKTDRWPSGMGISLLMGRHCRSVFERILRMRTGIVAPSYNPRHLTRYGGGS